MKRLCSLLGITAAACIIAAAAGYYFTIAVAPTAADIASMEVRLSVLDAKIARIDSALKPFRAYEKWYVIMREWEGDGVAHEATGAYKWGVSERLCPPDSLTPNRHKHIAFDSWIKSGAHFLENEKAAAHLADHFWIAGWTGIAHFQKWMFRNLTAQKDFGGRLTAGQIACLNSLPHADSVMVRYRSEFFAELCKNPRFYTYRNGWLNRIKAI